MSVIISYVPAAPRRKVGVKQLLANSPTTGAPKTYQVSERELRALRSYIRHLKDSGKLPIKRGYTVKTNGFNQLIDIVSEDGRSYYGDFVEIILNDDETFEV